MPGGRAIFKCDRPLHAHGPAAALDPAAGEEPTSRRRLLPFAAGGQEEGIAGRIRRDLAPDDDEAGWIPPRMHRRVPPHLEGW